MAASAFGADDVGWVSPKGRAWTHIWEQAFTDMTQLKRHLDTPNGKACSSVEGFAGLSINLGSLRIFTCPFELSPVDHQSPPTTPPDTSPVLYTITARTAVADADTYVELLERHYDPFMVEVVPAPESRLTVDSGLSEASHSLCRSTPCRLLATSGPNHWRPALDSLRQRCHAPGTGRFPTLPPSLERSTPSGLGNKLRSPERRRC